MRPIAVGVWLVAGCSFRPHAGSDGAVGDAPVIDATPDGTPIDAPSNCTAFTSHYFDACAIPAPDGDLDLDGGWTLSTDDGVLHGPNSMTLAPPGKQFTPSGGVEVLLLSVNTMHVHATGSLRVTGSRPLMIAAWDAIAIDGGGLIDATSTRAGGDGAGANPTGCTPPGGANPGADEVDNGGGSGGGGGGGLQGKGGQGGPGDTGGQNAGGGGGIAATAIATRLRGGCGGAAGGKAGPDPMVATPSDANTTAAGGSGGGAVLLAAKTQLAISGGAQILAGGAGGQGAELHSAVGGGGGGAGGIVALESAALQLGAGAIVAANGGGGGASAGFARVGGDGQDAQPGVNRALGGTVDACALAGALGGALAAPAGDDAGQTAVSCGGAGGGGGVGFVIVESAGSVQLGGVVVSPAATVNQLPAFSP